MKRERAKKPHTARGEDRLPAMDQWGELTEPDPKLWETEGEPAWEDPKDPDPQIWEAKWEQLEIVWEDPKDPDPKLWEPQWEDVPETAGRTKRNKKRSDGEQGRAEH